jgi:serine/threonine protein kinase
MPAFRRVKLKDGLKVGDWILLDGGQLGHDVWAVENSAGVAGVIKTARGSSDPWRSRFVHEVKVMDRLLRLPGVLRVLELDRGQEPTWMVTERATDLAEHLGAEPDFRTVVSAFADLAVTLVEAEEAAIAHRDIKPSNLFHVRGRAVVGDFGLATGHLHKDLTMEGGKVGPANFSAPETLAWKADTDPFKADVFSLAKSFWAVAAGEIYPPQGPLLIRLREVDQTDFGGRPAQDLARLLELGP